MKTKTYYGSLSNFYIYTGGFWLPVHCKCKYSSNWSGNRRMLCDEGLSCDYQVGININSIV